MPFRRSDAHLIFFLLGNNWVLNTEGKNLHTGQGTYLLTARFTTELGKLLSLGRNEGLFS